MKGTLHPIFVLAVMSIVFVEKCSTGTYEQQKSIFDTFLSSSVYNAQIRPVDDQGSAVTIQVDFELVSIIGIDDVGEKFIVNGFLIFVWTDQRLQWDPTLYGGELVVRPEVKAIWKPRVLLLNTVTKRDLFEDDHSPLFVDYTGFTVWGPGGVFSTSCDLDMSNYPYDTQTCRLQMISNGYRTIEMAFVGTNAAVSQTFFSESGEWDLVNSYVEGGSFPMTNVTVGGIEITFILKRKPTVVLLTVIVPVILLSFLNILVFLIPVESGEKMGYGITVLLAISVFLSIVSGLLPKSAKVVPNVTIYLSCLLILSVLTVIDCIIIIFLHNLEENEAISIKATENFQRSISKVKLANTAVAPMPLTLPRLGPLAEKLKSNPAYADMATPPSPSILEDSAPFPLQKEESKRSLGSTASKDGKVGSSEAKKPRKNKYRLIGKYIDLVSFVVFMVIWFSVTVGFMVTISKG